MKQRILRMLCSALSLCALCSAPVYAIGEGARIAMSVQIEPLPEFLLPDTTLALRTAMAGHLNTFALDVGYCADAQRGLLVEMTIRRGAEAMATVCIAADEEAVAFSGDLFPVGWYRIGYAELEALYPGPARWIAPLRALVEAMRGNGDDAGAGDGQARWEALWAGLLEKAGEWVEVHPQALREVDSVANPKNHEVIARQYDLDLRGRDLVDFNNRIFETLMASEWVRRELRALTLEALPGVEIGEDGLEEIELEIMRELKRQMAVELSGMHRPLYGKLWMDADGRFTDANLRSEPGREGEWTLWAHYERMSAVLEQWLTKAHWSLNFRIGSAKEALNGKLRFWCALPTNRAHREPDGFILEGSAWTIDAHKVRTDWEATLRGEEQAAAKEAKVVLSMKVQRLAEQAAGSLSLRIAADVQDELSSHFPDPADCVDLGHAPREEREAFEAEMAAARANFIARLWDGTSAELLVFFDMNSRQK